MKFPKPVKNKVLRVVAMLFSMVLGAALIFTAYGGRINPLETSLGAVAAMVFPFVLVVSLLALLVNSLWFRESAVVTVLSLIISWSGVLTYCPMHFFRPSEASIEEHRANVIKVMTYNMLNLDDFSNGFCRVGGGNPTLEYVLQQNPDIFLCQEGEPMLSENKKNISSEQHARLLEQFPYRKLNKRGMGILSKYPFEEVAVEHEDRWLYDVVRYNLFIGQDTVAVFNLHLQSLGLTSDDKALYRELTSGEPENMGTIRASLINKLTGAFRKRVVQARVVRAAIDSISGSVIVCGDFNDIPGCYAQRVIQGEDLSDAYREAGFGPAITYHANRFFFRIDHILYRGPFKPLRVWSGDNPSSDHFPLIAYFEMEQ